MDINGDGSDIHALRNEKVYIGYLWMPLTGQGRGNGCA
jgi:hypothetical protein